MPTAFDIRHPEHVAHELADMSRTLSREPEVPEWVGSWLGDLCQDIAETDAAELESVPHEDWTALQAAALKAAGALLHGDDADPRLFRRQVRLAIEELRFRLARMAEDQPVNDTQPVKDIAAWLDRNLDLSQSEKGALFGVSDRTWQRWISPAETAEPSGNTAVQLRLLARLVNELRHLLTSTGVLRWAARRLPDLDGRSPLEVFEEADAPAVSRVFALAAAARSGAAA